MEKISCFGGYGFILGEFIRKYPEETIRMEKYDVESKTPRVLFAISTTDNYNVFDNPTLDVETNLLHFMEVLDASHKKWGKDLDFTILSSWFVYGKAEFDMVENFPLMEEAPCNPKGFYSITARAREQLLISYCETFGIKYRILRLSNVLGIRDNKVSKKKNALQYLLDRLVHNEDIELYDNGLFYRDYIDVRDCVRGIKISIEQDKYNILNISSGTSYKFKDLIDQAVQYSQSKSNVWDKLDKPQFHAVVQSKNVYLSNQKLKELGYVPEYPIDQTIKDIIDFYRGR